MKGALTLVAFGGGGATNGADPLLEGFLLGLIGRARPAIGYCGAASGDDGTKFERLAARLALAGASLHHLEMTASAAQAARWAASVDAIYFGGGHTLRLVDHLRTSGWGDVLAEAARSGTLLAGVSAGALCWFEWALSDSAGDSLAPLAGLGLFAGSLCPHYSTEAERRRRFPELISAGALAGGVAIDDGVGVLFRAGAEPVAFTARPGRWAYEVASDGAGGAVIRPLAAAAAASTAR
jgi:peptidase E